MQIKEEVVNSGQTVGSCGIGRVVNKQLKVMGFSNLRVVDASVIPDMTENSGPLGTTYMLAEYMAETLIAAGSGTKPATGAAEEVPEEVVPAGDVDEDSSQTVRGFSPGTTPPTQVCFLSCSSPERSLFCPLTASHVG